MPFKYTTCPNGHTYPIRVKFLKRAIRKKRSLVCPVCVTVYTVQVKL